MCPRTDVMMSRGKSRQILWPICEAINGYIKLEEFDDGVVKDLEDMLMNLKFDQSTQEDEYPRNYYDL